MSFDIPLADQMRIALSYVKFKTKQRRLRTDEKVIADTVYGPVKGVKWRSVYGTSYYSFEGIPFAKPPLGRLRFKAPEEPESWTEVKRCTRVRAKPCQLNIILKQVQGREDCLYLNVYTRELDPGRPAPVLVWIYGGGFQMGEASRELYSPDYFMLEHVVLITISYRLGPLGFLSLDDPECDVPGNAGLKDQVLALKWVKRNCHFFGGDPENITVFGESAGGSSTHYMMLTEQTRGLFHKAVIMSGSAIAPWANIPQHNWAFKLAKATGYKGANVDSQVLQHLRHCKPSSMLKVCEDLLTLEERHQRLMFSFGPTIEPYPTEHCVIPRAPLEMMRSCWGNAVPLLIGGNSFEGLLMFTEARKYPNLLFDLKGGKYLPPADAHLTAEKRLLYGRLLKEAYFGDKEPSWDTILQYSDLFSYKYFWHGIHRTVLSRQQHATAPTYLYRFDFDSKHFNFMRIITCGRKVRGTCHADDLSYLFYNAGAKKLKHRTAEYKTIRRMVAIMVQFAETGDPNIPFTDHDHAAPNRTDGMRPRSKSRMHIKSHVNHGRDENGNDGDDDDDDGDGDGDGVEVNANDELDAHLHQRWLPVAPDDTTFKCLNISDELQVIDLPEAEKLKLWDSFYEDKSLLF